jgi:hypothetical protein
MNIWKIIRLVIVVGCIIGAYTYMGSVTSKRDRARQVKSMRREQALEKIQEAEREKEREIRKQKEEEENADNAEYQLNRWYDTYSRLKEVGNRRAVRRELREAREQLGYWIEKRVEELSSKRDEAEANDNLYERDKYDDLLEELAKKAETIDDGDWNEDE